MVTEERLQELEDAITKKTTGIAVGSAVVSGALSLAGIIYTYMTSGKKDCSCKLPPKSDEIKKPVDTPNQSARTRRGNPRFASARRRRY